MFVVWNEFERKWEHEFQDGSIVRHAEREQLERFLDWLELRQKERAEREARHEKGRLPGTKRQAAKEISKREG